MLDARYPPLKPLSLPEMTVLPIHAATVKVQGKYTRRTYSSKYWKAIQYSASGRFSSVSNTLKSSHETSPLRDVSATRNRTPNDSLSILLRSPWDAIALMKDSRSRNLWPVRSKVRKEKAKVIGVSGSRQQRISIWTSCLAMSYALLPAELLRVGVEDTFPSLEFGFWSG